MSLRARIFIIVSVFVFLILAASIFLIVRNRNKDTGDVGAPGTTATNTTNNAQSNNGAVNEQAGLTAKTLTPLEIEKNGVQQLAKIFVERYGSYSTDNEFQNIKESQALVTKSLWAKIGAGMNVKTTNKEFLGVTTKVFSLNLTDWSGDKATVTLRLMREENKNGVISIRYQNATVGMVKEGGVWLANTLVWN